jgi:hypothetical protein
MPDNMGTRSSSAFLSHQKDSRQSFGVSFLLTHHNQRRQGVCALALFEELLNLLDREVEARLSILMLSPLLIDYTLAYQPF